MPARRTLTLAVAAVAAVLLAAWVMFRPPGGGAFPQAVTDDEGVASTIPAPPRRIVSFAPQFTEMLLALGRGEAIVGVSAGETHPPAGLAIPAVASDDGVTPDVERIKQLGPDLVLAAGMRRAAWKDDLRDSGIPVVTLDATSIEDALEDLLIVGRLAGAAKDARSLVTGIREEARGVRRTASASPPPKVVFETFFPPLIAAGPEGFAGEMVLWAGGQVLGTGEQWEPSPDEILRAGPDVYLAASSSAISGEEVAARPGFEQIAPLIEERFYLVEDDLVLRPGPRLAQGLLSMARSLHPNSF